ncbi:hypothetical protein LZG04_38105 [Saccharothrix sp. S26]|uniref:hypothetical protein n=1 Tax=Saccharothrix sp. S26 TaxID=2907215 RepID=UPI001F374B0F|nr:hypothetical protein [Saccharothrix sp. S26]MCE7000588.1 hypothetical protein [Saccharothrix sp. S26]
MRRPVVLVLLVCALTASTGLPALAQPTREVVSTPGEPSDRLVPLAVLEYVGGTAVEFARGAETGDLVLHQQGDDGVNAPVVPPRATTFLEAYLAITPAHLPVPSALVGTDSAPPALAERRVVDTLVTATDLPAPTSGAAVRSACWASFFDQPVWAESFKGMTSATYKSDNYGGSYRYAGSGVVNCTPKTGPLDHWAKHRLYRSLTPGVDGIKILDHAIAPGKWSVAVAGAPTRRYWTVRYSDGWNSSPDSASQYYREGTFADSHP